jgi:glycosyltransferase involved in cell wall biosynthesis
MFDPRLYASLSRIESNILDKQNLGELYQANKDVGGLTIFIPNWNHRAFLPRALRSALDALEHLESEDFSAEIIVIDDASRDGSQKLLRTVQALYDEPRLKTLCLQQNLGLSRLRNLALKMSRFRYVCLMDADNELVPSNLPLFLRSILETDATMVYGNLIDRQGRDVVGVRSNMPVTLHLIRANYIDAFSIVDADRILRLGAYTRIHPYCPDDWEMNLHLIAEEEVIVFVPAVFGYYHKLPLSGNQENVPFAQTANATLRRVYAQTGTCEWDSMQVGRIYHPDVGFMDEW